MLGIGSIGKLAPHALVGTAVATGVVLFIPEGIAVTLGVDTLRGAYRGYFGWAFIFSIALFCSWTVETLFLKKKRSTDAAAKKAEKLENETRKKVEKLKEKERLKAEEEENERMRLEAGHQTIRELTPDEKFFIAPFIFQEATSQYAELESGVVQSLLNKSILIPPDGIGNIFDWPFHIQPWALKFLKKNPDILKGFEDSRVRKRRSAY